MLRAIGIAMVGAALLLTAAGCVLRIEDYSATLEADRKHCEDGSGLFVNDFCAGSRFGTH